MRVNEVYYVNLYLLDQGYGGPEEGGWWYTYGVFEETAAMFTDKDEAYDYARALNAETREVGGLNYDRPSMSSVNSQGEFHYQVEPHPGHDFPERRPYYE